MDPSPPVILSLQGIVILSLFGTVIFQHPRSQPFLPTGAGDPFHRVGPWSFPSAQPL